MATERNNRTYRPNPGGGYSDGSFQEHDRQMRKFRASHANVVLVKNPILDEATLPRTVTKEGLIYVKKQTCILAVDDEQAILKMLSRILEREGYGVILADNGTSALALLEEYVPDLVILDIMMPGLDGFQVLERIRQHSNVPVIMLTGRHEVTTLHCALSLGADDYMRKPFGREELIARIRAKLRRAYTGKAGEEAALES